MIEKGENPYSLAKKKRRNIFFFARMYCIFRDFSIVIMTEKILLPSFYICMMILCAMWNEKREKRNVVEADAIVMLLLLKAFMSFMRRLWLMGFFSLQWEEPLKKRQTKRSDFERIVRKLSAFAADTMYYVRFQSRFFSTLSFVI